MNCLLLYALSFAVHGDMMVSEGEMYFGFDLPSPPISAIAPITLQSAQINPINSLVVLQSRLQYLAVIFHALGFIHSLFLR